MGTIPRMTDGNLPARAQQRVGHDEREATAERLRIAAGDGRLTLEELEVRLEAALAARTYADLAVVTEDLPEVNPSRLPASARPTREPLRLTANHGKVDRLGPWDVPALIQMDFNHSNSTLDLRSSPLPAEGVTIELSVRHSSIRILVPLGARVEYDSLANSHGTVSDRGARRVTSWDDTVIRLVGELKHSTIKIRRPRQRRERRSRRG